jgi:hypothetical protein
MSQYSAKRDYCERVCRFASKTGAELHQDRLPGGLFRFTFIAPDGARHAGEPSQRREVALHSACSAYADAVL